MTLKIKAARAACAVLALLVLTLCLAGCADKIKPVEGTEQELQVVGKCDDYDIRYEELRFVTLTYKKTLENKYGEGIWDDPKTAEQHRAELEELVLENLKVNYAVLTGCKNLFVDTEAKAIDEYVQEEIETLINQSEDKGGFGGDFDAYLDWLAENGLTDHYLRFVYHVNFLESAMYQAVISAGIFEYSQENYPDFIDYVLSGGDYVRTIHVYIPVEKIDQKQSYYDTAKKIADELAECESDEDRYNLMCRHIGSKVNKDLTITESGYYFTYNEMGKSYEDAAFALGEYQTSDVVEYGDGFYVLMRLPIQEHFVMMNGQQMLQYYQSARMGEYEDTIKANMTVELNEYGKSLDLTQIK